MTAKLTTGTLNALFIATGDRVEVLVHDLNTNAVDRETVTIEAGRRQYAMLRKMGAIVGATRPSVRVRKITTDAQFAAWARAEFDLVNDDNAAESLMVSDEIFAGQGFLEVAA